MKHILVVIDGKILDFENPQNLDESSPNAYKIRTTLPRRKRDTSTESAPGVYDDENETDFPSTMDLTIHLQNTIEPPYFIEIPTNDADTNFSIDEQTFASFVVEAGTDDFDKDINVSLITDQKDGGTLRPFQVKVIAPFNSFYPLILKTPETMASTTFMRLIS